MLNTPDTYLHAIWSCPPVTLFWKEVIKTISTRFNCNIPINSLCLLGDTSVISTAKE